MSAHDALILVVSIVGGTMAGLLGANVSYITLLHRLTACESFLRAQNVAVARRERKDRDREIVEAARREMDPTSPEQIMERARTRGLIS